MKYIFQTVVAIGLCVCLSGCWFVLLPASMFKGQAQTTEAK